MEKNIITIFCDKRHNYYVKVDSWSRTMLPEGSEIKDEHRKILPDAFPNMANHISKSRYVDDEIMRMIRIYNEGVKSSQVVRWYKYNSSKNKLDDMDTAPTGIDKYIGHEYTGDPNNPDDIISFINKLKKESNHRIYATFVCPECGKMQIQLVKNKKGVQCDNCKKYFDNIRDSKIIKGACGFDSENGDQNKANAYFIHVFDSENSDQNEANAYSILQQWKKGQPSDVKQDVKGNFPFCFKGNVYNVNYNDSECLHKELYRSFAVQEVFILTKKGITFTEDYKNYIESLGTHNIQVGAYKALHKETLRIENQINSQENSCFSIEKAFYWYMNKYCLTNETKLIWPIGDEIASFDSTSQFVKALLEADEKKIKQLISVYKEVTDLDLDNSFFANYGRSEIGLSYMIYDEEGLFVRITTEGQLVRFGKSFIDDLHEYDDLISERNIFIEEIKQYGPFWDRVKGSFDDSTDYYESSDNTYYDRLCFYQYAIQGKSVLRYKNITLSDSVQGFEEMKDVVRRAYTRKYQENIETYKCYVELLKIDNLWYGYDRFSKLRDSKTIKSGKKVLDFDSLREAIVNNPETPSVDLYLKCLDTSYKSIPSIMFLYNDKLNTLSSHIMALVDDASTEIVREVSKFYNNSDTTCVINCFLDNTIEGGAQKFKEEQEKAFSVLVKSGEELKEFFEKQRESISQNAKRGIERKEEPPKVSKPQPSVPQPSKPVNNISSNKNPAKKRRKDDEWS